MDGTIHIVSLDQKPCVVNYLEQFNKFLVGTYELFPSIDDARCKLNSRLDDETLKKEIEKINQRAGKLVLLRGNDVKVPCIEYEFDCDVGGGVFDVKVRYSRADSSYGVFVAHSNGTVGIYKLALQCGNKISLREHINISGSTMLTSIDLISSIYEGSTDSSDSSCSSPITTSAPISEVSLTTISSRRELALHKINRLVVGDSDGFVTALIGTNQIRRDVASGNSIWQVKSIRLTSGQDVFIVGAENSSWYIMGLDESTNSLNLLYANSSKDFTAGVTCISVLNMNHFNEYDLVEILLGSYDETIQIYHIKLKQDGLSRPDVCHKDTFTIADGGIWRVKPHRGKIRRQFCVAAMYAGTYILNLDQDLNQDAETRSKLLVETKSLKLENKPLHYDVDVSTEGTTYCIVDFNNSLCLFKTI